MPNVRQMPELYLRGSLANITMRNLTKSQRNHVDELVAHIAEHPDMQRHRIKVMKELGVTIAADYSDDRAIAEEEYRIAIWRGVVDLFYHRKYTFNCRACSSSTYMTKRSKPKAIDRVQTPCPNCRQVEIENPGDVQLLQEMLVRGEKYITQEAFQDSYKDLPDGFAAPTYKSTIDYVPGQLKYSNPQAIIDDDKQLRKFFGEFVWNYFRQAINENKRKEHKKEPVGILGNTDWLILQELISLCNQMEIDYNFCDKTEPQNGVYSIRLCGLTTPPEFSAEFARLKAKGELYCVPVNVTENTIEVVVTPNAPPMPIIQDWVIGSKTERIVYPFDQPPKNGRLVSQYQVQVYKPEHVSVLDNFVSMGDDQEADYTISQISYRTVGGYRMDLDDHVTMVDNSEVMQAVRDALPDGHCRDIFDIFSGQGEKYNEFSARYGDGDPAIKAVADFLGITTRAVTNYKQSIKVHSLANNLVPS